MLLKYSEELNDAIHYFNSYRFRAIIKYQEAEKFIEEEKQAEDYFRKRDLQAEFENSLNESLSLFEKAGEHLEAYKKQDLENSKQLEATLFFDIGNVYLLYSKLDDKHIKKALQFFLDTKRLA